MKIRNKINGGLAEVGDQYPVDWGTWELADAPKKQVRKTGARRGNSTTK